MAKQTVKAIVCVQNNKKFYIASINSSILKETCFVSRRKEDPQKGFQRLLNPKRAKSIAAYLDEVNGVIPSSLILSAQPNIKLNYNESTGNLSFDVIKDGFMVIDGQHRLYGLNEASHDYDFPVVIFDGLTSQEEVRLFIDINTTQKGVPSALILDIKQQAGTQTKIEERQRLLFDSMNNNSVMKGFLLPNESKTGKISRTVFYESTKSIFESGPLSNSDDDSIYRCLKNYLAAVDEIFRSTGDKEARLNKSIIFRSIMAIFNDVCEKCLLKYQNLKQESFRDYLSPLENLPYSDYTGTNKSTQTRIVNDMKAALIETVSIADGDGLF